MMFCPDLRTPVSRIQVSEHNHCTIQLYIYIHIFIMLFLTFSHSFQDMYANIAFEFEYEHTLQCCKCSQLWLSALVISAY